MIIIKGNAIENAGALAAYMTKGDGSNERISTLEVRDFGGRDLQQGMRMAQIEAETSKGQKPFWHAQIAPAPGVKLTREQQLMAADVLERHLGFEGQPRAVIMHFKDDREHLHVAWSRYDRETGTLRRDDFSKRKNVAAAAEIAQRLGLEPNPNPFEDREDLAREERRDRTHQSQTHGEFQQDDRAHKSRKERKAEINALWEATDSGQALRSALDEAGYTLARGWRGFVVVDECGETHGLARQVDGIKEKQVRERLADLEPGSILASREIKAAMREARQERDREQARKRPDLPRETAAEDPAEATQRTSRDLGIRQDAPRPSDQGQHPAKEARQTGAELLAALTVNHSTFTRQDILRAADKATDGAGQQPWLVQEGGLEALDERSRRSAERSYARWAAENPGMAKRFGLAPYVAYVQDQQAQRDAAKPGETATRKANRAEYDRLAGESLNSPELVDLGPDRHGRHRYSTRDMVTTELEMAQDADRLTERNGHAVSQRLCQAIPNLENLGDDQRAAFDHVTGGGDLAMVTGFAGTGKSHTLGLAREAWEAAGFRVRGVALSGIAAEALQQGSSIKSRTLDSQFHQWDTLEKRMAEIAAVDAGLAHAPRSEKGTLQAIRDRLAADLDATRLTARDVVVLDEAAMVGSRKLGRLLAEAEQAGAKVVMVGDQEQLQAIDAGAGFRHLAETHGAAEITDVRRQRHKWMREASQAFGRTETTAALSRYEQAGMIHDADTRAEAKEQLVEAWTEARARRPDQSQIILAHTRADVAELNDLARNAYRAEGRLGEAVKVQTASGEKDFAQGDRLYFTKNDRQLDVKNGSLGSVESVAAGRFAVRLDSGRTVEFSPEDYSHIAHGYAATVHKSQGVTVDRAHVLASRYMDRHAAYVGMTRHRDRADLYYGADEFRDFDTLAGRLSRNGAKDTTLDYIERATEGRGSESLKEATADFHERREAHQARVPPEQTETHRQPQAPAGAPSPWAKMAAQAREAQSRQSEWTSRLTAEQQARHEQREAARLVEELKRKLDLQRGLRGPTL